LIEIWNVPIVSGIDDIVDLLRTELSLQKVDLLKDTKNTFDNVMVTCIAHGDGVEKHPSCGISTVRKSDGNGGYYPAGTVHCFTCGYTADLPTFISNCFGHNDRGYNGFKWLTSNFVNLAIEKRKPLDIKLSREQEVKEVEFVSEEELSKYRFTHPYMYHRKLTDEVIDYFDVGYDKETDSLTFPIHDIHGNVLFIQRRGVSKKTFMNADHAEKGSTLYGYYQVLQNLSWIKELIICESPIDALTCWTRRRPAVATLGVALTKEQIKLLQRLPVTKYIEGFDRDKAGRIAAAKLKKRLGNTKLIYTVDWGDTKDWNLLTDEQWKNLQPTIL